MRVAYTYDGWKEAAGTERSECECQSERSHKENDGQQKDIRYSLCDSRLVASTSGQIPALLQALLLRNTVLTHFYALFVSQAILIHVA